MRQLALAALAAAFVTPAFGQADAQACTRLSREELLWATGGLSDGPPPGDYMDEMPPMRVDYTRFKVPADGKRCSAYLAKQCPDYDPARFPALDSYCMQARLVSGPLNQIGALRAALPPCEFRAFSREVMDALGHDPEAQLRWCVNHVRSGGEAACLSRLRAQVKADLALPFNRYHHPAEWLAGWFSNDLPHPQFRPLLPWLRSLPRPRDPEVRDARDLAIAVHTRDRFKLLRVIGFGDSSPAVQASYWYLYLFPKRDLSADLGAIGARESARLFGEASAESFKREVEILKAGPSHFCAAQK